MNDWKNDDKTYVWHPFTQMKTADDATLLTRAKDTLIHDEAGNSYIDVNSSWWVNVHGHCRPEIITAINEQFQQMDHVIFAGASHPKAIELSKRIVQKLDAPFQKVFFSDNGSTAVEVALKMAIQYGYNRGEEKHKFIALDGAYHGDTFGAMAVGQRGYFNQAFEAFFFEVDYLPFPTSENENQLLLQAETHFSKGDIAAFIVEPLIQGSAGMRMYSPDVLDKLVQLAKKYAVLVIFDEVMTGFGRTGKLFAMEHCQERPDIICLSKGLTAGVIPLGLTVATQAIYDAFLDDSMLKALLHGHSFTGNSIACSVACASLDLFELKETWNHIERISQTMHMYAKELTTLSNKVQVAAMGTILRVEISSEESSYFNNIKKAAVDYFKKNGIWLRPLGNVLFFNPPYCIKEEELNHCFAVLKNFMNEQQLID